MRTHFGWKGLVLCAAVALASASPALAQQQTVNFTIGGFVPRSEDSRVAGDVLNENRQLFASKYMLYLPTEEALREELERERALVVREQRARYEVIAAL